VAVRQAALDRELLIEGADRLAAEDGADGLDGLNGKGGEVGEGAMLDLGALAVGLAEQVGRVLTAALTAGDDGYVPLRREASLARANPSLLARTVACH